MTIQEEIELLKAELSNTKKPAQQAEVLLQLLKKYVTTKGTDYQVYLEQLYHLARTLNSNKYLSYAKLLEGKLEYFRENYAVSLIALQEALTLFQGEDQDKIPDIYSNIGHIYERQGNYPEALKNHKTALEQYEQRADKQGIGICLANIGNIYLRQGNYPAALQNSLVALKVFEEIEYKKGIGECYNDIGLVHLNQNNYSEAQKNFETALKFREEANDTLNVAGCFINIGIIQSHQQHYADALKSYSAALNIFEKTGNKKGIGNTYINIGNVYYKQSDYPNSIKNYLNALTIKKETNDKKAIATCYINIGNAYLKQRSYQDALHMFHQAQEIANAIGTKDLEREVYLGLSDLAQTMGNYEDALKHYKLYDQVKSQILGAEAQKQLTNLRFIHDMETKEKQLEIEHLRNVELKQERDRSESLLLNILPQEVAEELKNKGAAEAKLFDEVTVLFTDFKSFTTVSEKLTPKELVNELNECFSAFDKIIEKYNIEKIKTVGDAYLAAAGLPSPNISHADDMINAALEMRNFMLNRKKQLGNRTFEMRVGIHSGNVVAGIVGVKKFAYDIWGDTVNTAARMEQNGEAGKVNISEATYNLVKDKFNCEYRGEIEAKNKGKLKMYFVS